MNQSMQTTVMNRDPDGINQARPSLLGRMIEPLYRAPTWLLVLLAAWANTGVVS